MADPVPNRRLSELDKVAMRLLAPAQADDELGRLGRYRVLKTLGKGGMGMVFKAEDPSLQRTVALKIMLPEIAKRGAARERFLREARVAAQIEHEHIISIFQVDEDRNIPFIAMSFLKGMSLEDWLRTKPPLAIPQILRIGRETAKGLEAAHERSLIHRDIKPANLWLDASAKGRVKILDFGLARPETDDTGLTRSGQIVGTPAYMSPEQAAGEKLDGRSDLFSLGVVLYRLVSGQLPFRGNSMIAVLTALATQDPAPVESLAPETPPALSRLIGRLLAKRREDRPARAEEVVDTIGAIERERFLERMGNAAAPTAIVKGPPTRVTASQAVDFAEDSSDSYLSDQDFASTRPATRSTTTSRPWLWPAIAGSVIALVGVLLFAIVSAMPTTKPVALPEPVPPIVKAEPMPVPPKTTVKDPPVTPSPIVLAPAAPVPASAWKTLSTGKDYVGWSMPTWGPVRNKDVFKTDTVDGDKVLFLDGVSSALKFYLTSKGPHEKYHLRVEFRFPPEITPSTLYHLLFHQDDTRAFTVHLKPGETGTLSSYNGRVFDPARWENGKLQVLDPKRRNMVHQRESENAEKPAGEWNVLDLLCVGDAAVVVLNGHVVNAAMNLRQTLTGKSESITKGDISFNTPGAEHGLYLRKIQIRPIASLDAMELAEAKWKPAGGSK